MIAKHGEYKNGYIFTPSSTNEDLQEIFKSYNQVNCVICNKYTAKKFITRGWGKSIVTINNKIADGCFFVNGTF